MAGTQGLGAFGLHLDEDGGLVCRAALEVGFGRRNIESISRQLPLAQGLNYADRIDALAAPAYNFALATCFEELLSIEVPERAQHIRLILLELNRIGSHLHFYARLARSLGQLPLTNHCLREREKFSDIMEMYCGSRLGFGSICLGGVVDDATDGWFFRIEKAISSLKEFFPDLSSSLLAHPFFEERARGLARVTAEDARRWDFRGPNARASGLTDSDIRWRRPYGAYRTVEIPPFSSAHQGGDALARAWIRMEEMLHSANIIEGCFRRIPSGNHRIRVGIDVVPSAGVAFCEVEGPRGAISVFTESHATVSPTSVLFSGPSALVVQRLPELLRGIQLDDIFLALQSFDVSFLEVDK
jgi:NADH-quinone oxidoreductase subunit D